MWSKKPHGVTTSTISQVYPIIFNTMEEVMEALRLIQKELDEQKNVIYKSGEEVIEKVTLNINNI